MLFPPCNRYFRSFNIKHRTQKWEVWLARWLLKYSAPKLYIRGERSQWCTQPGVDLPHIYPVFWCATVCRQAEYWKQICVPCCYYFDNRCALGPKSALHKFKLINENRARNKSRMRTVVMAEGKPQLIDKELVVFSNSISTFGVSDASWQGQTRYILFYTVAPQLCHPIKKRAYVPNPQSICETK